MNRVTLAVLIACAAPLTAADPPAPKASSVGVHLVAAQVVGDTLTYELTVYTSVVETRTEERDLNGKTVLVTVPVERKVPQKRVVASPLDNLKATTADGKEVSATDLKAKLKGGKRVVALDGPLSDEWRALFKPDTIFIEPKK